MAGIQVREVGDLKQCNSHGGVQMMNIFLKCNQQDLWKD